MSAFVRCPRPDFPIAPFRPLSELCTIYFKVALKQKHEVNNYIHAFFIVTEIDHRRYTNFAARPLSIMAANEV